MSGQPINLRGVWSTPLSDEDRAGLKAYIVLVMRAERRVRIAQRAERLATIRAWKARH